jgi:tRNA-(ms[2]io[6]A)-hydroxylase
MDALASHPDIRSLAVEEDSLAVVIRSVPLQSATQEIWVDTALAHPLELLDDHAQCELKASTSALALIGRHPEHDELVRRMSALATEEMQHYRMVRDLLILRGGKPTRPLPNAYVKGLAAGRLGGKLSLMDDLVVAALIEARSCERFIALFRGLRDGRAPGLDDPEALAMFYEKLARSESGHAHLFVALAESIFEPDRVHEQLENRCRIESGVLDGLPVSPRMHGGHLPA